MRDGWGDVRLADVAVINPRVGGVDADTPFITMSDVAQWGRIARASGPRGTRSGIRAHGGDVLVARITPCLENGKIGIVDPALVIAGGSTEFIVLRGTERVDSEFLYLWAQSRETHTAAVSMMIGSTGRQRVSASDFASLPLRLPPLAEQRRIIDLIAAVDIAIEAAEGAAETSADARRSLWRQLASASTRVEEVGTVSQGRSLPKEIQGSRSGDISWFKIADMTSPENVFAYTLAATRVSRAVLESQGGRITPVGSVSFPRVGAAVATEKKRLLEIDAALDENHIAVTPISEGVEEVLLAAFESVRLGDLARSGAVPSLNMGLIRMLEIPWPDDATDIRMMNALFGGTRLTERAARAQADALRTLRSNLLTVLLSGEHEIPSSYDKFLSVNEEAAA